MRFKISRAPGSFWFYIWKATPGVRDLGDYNIFFCGFEIKVFKKDNPFYKSSR